MRDWCERKKQQQEESEATGLISLLSGLNFFSLLFSFACFTSQLTWLNLLSSPEIFQVRCNKKKFKTSRRSRTRLLYKQHTHTQCTMKRARSLLSLPFSTRPLATWTSNRNRKSKWSNNNNNSNYTTTTTTNNWKFRLSSDNSRTRSTDTHTHTTLKSTCKCSFFFFFSLSLFFLHSTFALFSLFLSVGHL